MATFVSLAVSSSPPALDDRGVFILSSGGREIGEEKFSIRAASGRIHAQAEIELRVAQEGKLRDFKSFPNLTLTSDLRPLTYSWRQKGPQSSSLEIDFGPSPAAARYRTVSGQEERRDFVLSKDVLVLDDNVIHHYALVVSRYRQTGGGKRTFQAFIPQEALPGTLTIEEADRETVTLGGASERWQHFVLTTDLARVDLWAGDDGRLQRVSIPAAQIEAIRKK